MRGSAILATLTIGFSLVATDANAELVCKIGSFKGSKFAIATRPGKAGEFYSLMDKKFTEEAIRCCVACTIDTGTSVIITDQGFASHTIRVLEGKAKGCVGDVPAEYVKDCN
jgi:hypothetical protein